MASSDVAIVNSALLKLGHKTITALTDDDNAARAANAIYADTRDDVLQDFPWAFATLRATLGKLSTGPTWGFANRFQLPTDLLRLLNTDEETAAYRRETDTIVSDRSDMSIRYIARITDPTKFSAKFADALASRLAHELCMAITGRLELKQAMWNAYQEALRRAKGTDDEERGLDQHDVSREQSNEVYRPLVDVR